MIRATMAARRVTDGGVLRMQAEFWHERWQRNEIGFHEAAVHAGLQKYWSTLGLPSGCEVLVPLCGKSIDMHWLAERGHRVLGVELSALACAAFFEEAKLAVRVRSDGRFQLFESGPYRLLCGDFFDLTATDLAAVRGVYDRAALVALPPEMRRRYADVLRLRVPAAAPILLITFDYEQQLMAGPPHAVSLDEVHALYASAFKIQVCDDSGRIEPPARLKERGLTWLAELNIALTR